MVNVAIVVAKITIQPREESCEGVVNNNINNKSLGVVSEDGPSISRKHLFMKSTKKQFRKNITTQKYPNIWYIFLLCALLKL